MWPHVLLGVHLQRKLPSPLLRLRKWLQSPNSQSSCPMCKNVIQVDQLITLYVDGETSKQPRREIPKRPVAQRVEIQPTNFIQLPPEAFNFLETSSLEIKQKPRLTKFLCCLQEDKFESGNQLDIMEESTCSGRFCGYFLCNMFQRVINFRVMRRSPFAPLFSVWQSPIPVCCFGLLHMVGIGHEPGPQNKFGMMGLPCPCMLGMKTKTGCLGGCATVLQSCVCMRYPITTRWTMHGCSALCFCCTKCRTMPVLLMGENSQPLYTIDASLCQPGVLFSGLCCGEKCRRIEFDVRDQRETNVGKIIRTDESDSLCICIQASNNFRVIFPQGASIKEKAILFGSALTLYSFYFDI
eukprot:TRINITY_DN2109_c0_g2_i2.p1 TRINITY_DN2109_c0_g2~~TRINITY_DN2109_c0_g2_i2.p1  ORF type:complete len:353 (-),score=22.81 TRINITY_DN2109_c0_g2_i2:120-1178(-)